MTNIEKYFGQDGLFAQACEIYKGKRIPAEILEHAATLGDSRIAYSLGWAFASVLTVNGIPITAGELEEVAEGKITQGKPQEFINGFHAWKPRD